MYDYCVLTLIQVLGMKRRFTWLKRAGEFISFSEGEKINQYVRHKSCYVLKNGLLHLKHELIPIRRHQKRNGGPGRFMVIELATYGFIFIVHCLL